MTDKWKEKYYELLEKHNDYIDTLMGEVGFDCPRLIVIVKLYGSLTSKDAIDSIQMTIENSIPKDSKLIIVACHGSTSDLRMEMFPLHKLLFGKEFPEQTLEDLQRCIKEIKDEIQETPAPF